MTLTEFLLARIDEDEAKAIAEVQHGRDFARTGWPAPRVLAECRAKARTVAAYLNGDTSDLPLRILAAVYETHPDYDKEWKP